MGRAIVAQLPEQPTLKLAAAVEQSGSSFCGQDSGRLAGLEPNGIAISDQLPSALALADVVVDFSSAQQSAHLLDACVAARIPCVIGTTGQTSGFAVQVEQAARSIAVLQAANTSVGVTLLLELARLAAQALPQFDIEIIEAHHRLKKDAPSGTALALGRAAAQGRGAALEALRAAPRDGEALRTEGEIGFAVVRGGDIVGDHDVVLAGAGERVVLRHQATDRAIFARGALQAAAWLVGRAPGRYDMRQVIGLKTIV
jgi:4-hydroxy-tetrahydrodipicolinate reductase